MAAGIYNFTIEQGATFIRTFIYKDSDGNPINLGEATALRMQIRENVGSTSPVTGGTFSISSGDGFSIQTPAGGSTQNQFTLTISAATTTAYTFTTAVYDIEYEDSNNVVTRLLQGKIKLSKEVTR